jgi:tRNA(fMet)-specific endonuclease VapC
LIFDTDILVWVLRRHVPAVEFVEHVPLAERKVSAVSRLELLYGCRDRIQLQRLQKHIDAQYAEIIPLSEMISVTAGRLMETFVLSRRPQVNDVLIAATALQHGEALATANLKHFDFVPGLKLRPFRP